MNHNKKTYKPFAYIDHNIIIWLGDNKLPFLKNLLKETFQVIYSDENLNEIQKAKKANRGVSSLLSHFS